MIVEKLVDMYGEAGQGEEQLLHFAEEGHTVYCFVGVHGAGKTNTVGQLALTRLEEGKRVLLVAADTFRAGANSQLQEWGRRVEVPVVDTNPGGDPAAVVFDGVKRE